MGQAGQAGLMGLGHPSQTGQMAGPLPQMGHMSMSMGQMGQFGQPRQMGQMTGQAGLGQMMGQASQVGLMGQVGLVSLPGQPGQLMNPMSQIGNMAGQMGLLGQMGQMAPGTLPFQPLVPSPSKKATGGRAAPYHQSLPKAKKLAPCICWGHADYASTLLPALECIDRATWHAGILKAGHRDHQDMWDAALVGFGLHQGSPWPDGKHTPEAIQEMLMVVHEQRGQPLRNLSMADTRAKAKELREQAKTAMEAQQASFQAAMQAHAAAHAQSMANSPVIASHGLALSSSPATPMASSVATLGLPAGHAPAMLPSSMEKGIVMDPPTTAITKGPDGRPFLSDGHRARFLARKDSGGDNDWQLIPSGSGDLVYSPATGTAVPVETVLSSSEPSVSFKPPGLV
jgi:hypothetical protein